jgi:hypothetical protein
VCNAPSFKCGTLWKPYTVAQLATEAQIVLGAATVQLSNKGSKVYCFEGAREDVLSHELCIGDDKGRADIVPAHKIVGFRVIDKAVQREWRLAREREGSGRSGERAIRIELVQESRHARLRRLEDRQLCRGLQRHGALTGDGGKRKRCRGAKGD